MKEHSNETLREWRRNYRLDILGGLLLVPASIALVIYVGVAFIAMGLGGVYLIFRGGSGLERLRAVESVRDLEED